MEHRGDGAARTVGFAPHAPQPREHHLSGKELAKQLSASFNPPTWAEPQAAAEASEEGGGDVGKEAPSVLTKLQKWGDYNSVGESVKPTKFIPMKTPMSREIISNWTLGTGPKHSLTVPELLEKQAAKGRTVGMIIDLANHECLYADDIPDSVEYAHVQLIAKVLPPPEAIKEVSCIANEFWAREPDKHIAIHCAYGFNRTGFVVCAYLIECCGLSVDAAMESFAEARPPGVKHDKFINELYLRYGGGQSRGASRRSSAGSLQVDLRREGSGSAGGLGGEAVAATADGSREVRRIPSRGSSRGGISVAVEAEQQVAGGAAEGDGKEEEEEEEEGMELPLGDLQPASNLCAEADRLESSGVAVGRSTSLGLAKALCEDFSMFEGTPVRPSPLTVVMAQEAAAFAYASGLSPMDSPMSPGQQAWAGSSACPVHSGGVVAGYSFLGADCTQHGASAPVAEATDCTCNLQSLPPQPKACADGIVGQAASNCSNSRGSSPALGGPGCSNSAGTGAGGQCHAGAPGLPPGSRNSLTGSGGSSAAPATANHSLPPLPYSTPAGVGCGAGYKPVSPTSSSGAHFDSSGGGGLVATGPRVASRGPTVGGSRFMRSMSVESDNQSLGFGMRQAIMTLRGHNGSPPPGDDRPLTLLDLFNSDAGSRGGDMAEYDDLEEHDWEEKQSSKETSRVSSHVDVAAAGPGAAMEQQHRHPPPASSGGARQQQQQQGQGQHWHPQTGSRGREKPQRQAGAASSRCRVM